MAVAVLSGPAPVVAQQPGSPGDEPGWPAPQVGVHLGFDQGARGEVIGAQFRIPVLPGASVELVPSGEITFLTGLRDYGFNVDAVYVSGGRQGGLYVGGGLALRSSIFTDDANAGRETKTGFGGVVGLKGGGPGPFGTQVEFRWIFLPDVDYDPRVISLGVNFALWGRDTR